MSFDESLEELLDEADEVEVDDALDLLQSEPLQPLAFGLQEPLEQSLPYEPELDDDELLELQSEPLHPLSLLEPQSEP